MLQNNLLFQRLLPPADQVVDSMESCFECRSNRERERDKQLVFIILSSSSPHLRDLPEGCGRDRIDRLELQTHTHACTHTCTLAHAHTHFHTHKYAPTNTHARSHVHTHTHTYINTRLAFTQTYIHTDKHVQACTHTH